MVTGPCSENVSITRDDVTLQGVAPGTVVSAANAAGNTIYIDGARRVTLSNLDVRGGFRGIAANRGATVDVRDCTVQGASAQGVLAGSASIVAVDTCTLQNNLDGGVAANGSSLFVTNSTVQNNSRLGLFAIRNSHIRVGQDASGGAAAPVTLTSNGSDAVAVLDASSGIVLGGVIEAPTTAALVYVARSSTVQIGLGLNGVQAATTVRNGGGTGVYVEGSWATILNTTVSGHAGNGITITNGGSARIGINEAGTAYAANTVSANGLVGIQISDGASAYIGGNVIESNGTNAAATGNREGIGIYGAAAVLPGGNTIRNNQSSGIGVFRNSSVIMGTPFGSLSTVNTITNNGLAGSLAGTVNNVNASGVFVGSGSVADIRNATLTGNVGAGLQLFENAVADLRATSIMANTLQTGAPVGSFNGGHGAVIGLRSTLRVRLGSDLSNNQGDGVQVFNGSAVDFRADAVSTVNGNGGFGLRCLTPEDSVTGDTSGIGSGAPNAAGAVAPDCTSF
jgi:hypothetical protein